MAKYNYEHPVFFTSLHGIVEERVVESFNTIFRSLDELKKELSKSINSLYNGDLPVALPSHTVAALPSASTYVNTMIYVSDETGGAIPAFSDGTNWRRVTDRAVVS